MPKHNSDRITKLISELLMSLESLRELGLLSAEDFLSDRHKISSAKYNLVVAIESLIDICNHIISKNRYRSPEDYADTFRVMFEVGALDETLTEKLEKMARFRNRLIHIYWDIDNREIYRIIKENLGDFEQFLNAIKIFLGL